MRCVAVSDIHCRDVKTPDADLLIVSGDMTMKGSPGEMSWFSDWLQRQPQKHKVWIAGNHELGIEETPDLAKRVADRTGSVYLNDSEVVIEKLRIWGSPITPWFYDWAFNRRRGKEIREHWLAIPEGLDILITHGPPFRYLDITRGSEHVGCEELEQVILEEMREPPQVHIFGHIHPSYGHTTVTRRDGKTIELINASSCNEQYQATNAPIVFEILPRSIAQGQARAKIL